jgi:hypothetical protein
VFCRANFATRLTGCRAEREALLATHKIVVAKGFTGADLTTRRAGALGVGLDHEPASAANGAVDGVP